MSVPHSLPDNGTQIVANGFLFDDWNLVEKSPSEDTAPFDGKIIARMPDLGSNEFVKSTAKPMFSAFWGRIRRSVAPIQGRMSESVRSFLETRQPLFHRITAFGGALLLCGIGILFLDQNKNEPTGNSLNIVNIISENTEPSATEAAPVARNESAFSPVVLPEANNVPPDSGVSIPVADFAAVQNSVASSSEHTDSAWNRPVTHSYSPWDVAAKQPESFSPSPDVVTVAPPPATPSMTVAMAPMTPMVPMSMPVSPYERQLVAQSSPPARPPVDPFIQASNPHVPGMMPMHERLENMMNTNSQNAPRSASASPLYPPLVTVQGGVPVNVPPHGQYGQHPYVAPPNPMSSNVPIPSGVSTLPTQNGYYAQPYTQPYAPPAQNPAGNTYPNAPTYRRVY